MTDPTDVPADQRTEAADVQHAAHRALLADLGAALDIAAARGHTTTMVRANIPVREVSVFLQPTPTWEQARDLLQHLGADRIDLRTSGDLTLAEATVPALSGYRLRVPTDTTLDRS